VWNKHRKAGTGVKRLESEGLESGLETGCSSLRINTRISIGRLSGRLIEVALSVEIKECLLELVPTLTSGRTIPIVPWQR
jgi:hypothetical protein